MQIQYVVSMDQIQYVVSMYTGSESWSSGGDLFADLQFVMAGRSRNIRPDLQFNGLGTCTRHHPLPSGGARSTAAIQGASATPVSPGVLQSVDDDAIVAWHEGWPVCIDDDAPPRLYFYFLVSYPLYRFLCGALR